MPASQLSQIQRFTIIRAPRSRVWKALTEIRQFCTWFHAATEDANAAFQAGADVRLISTYPGPYCNAKFSVTIVDVIPEQTFSWRWHPGAPLAGQDLTAEPMTLVEFRLEDVEGGTRVTVTETGFDLLFADRRARAIEDNTGGWKFQMVALEQYLSAKE